MTIGAPSLRQLMRDKRKMKGKEVSTKVGATEEQSPKVTDGMEERDINGGATEELSPEITDGTEERDINGGATEQQSPKVTDGMEERDTNGRATEEQSPKVTEGTKESGIKAGTTEESPEVIDGIYIYVYRSKCSICVHNILIGGECERAPHLIIQLKFV